jgi:hypothetical protein
VPNKLEIELRRIGRSLADKQICRFWKVPEEMQQTPCDFFGYTNTGRAILIEAKMAQRNHLPIVKAGKKGTGISDHQLQEIREARNAGAVAFFVWMKGEECAIFYPSIIMDEDKSVLWSRFSPIPFEKLEDYLAKHISALHATRRRLPSPPAASPPECGPPGPNQA